MGGFQSTTVGSGVSGGILRTAASENNNNGRVVLVSVDPSKQAEAAFDWYVKHLHRPDNIVRVIHCQELHTPSFFYDLKSSCPADTIEESVHRAKETGSTLINKYEGKLRRYEISGSVHSEYGPTPGEVVISAADRYKAGHIVMGSRGLGAIRRTILGSVSEYVIHHTKVPVTVVPRETNKGGSIY